MREIVRQIEEGMDRFKSSLDSALDNHRLNGTRTEDEVNEYVKRFEEATDRLRDPLLKDKPRGTIEEALVAIKRRQERIGRRDV